MSKNKFYSIVKGSQVGIFNQWDGAQGANVLIDGFRGAVYKGFPTLQQAEQWFIDKTGKQPIRHFILDETEFSAYKAEIKAALDADRVVIFTDGACSGNPGPGGYGVILMFDEKQTDLSGGFRLTTNNRMELMACIQGLQALKRKCSVLLFSDSRYAIDGITKGWALRWRENGWMKNSKDKALNSDLWEKLLDLIDQHDVEFVWVEGHTGNPENERCDQLSVSMAQSMNLPSDTEFEKTYKHG